MGLYALCRRSAGALAGARADQRDVLDHRRVFRLAFAACPRRGQLVRAGLSGVRDRGRGRRPSRAMGARASSALVDFCLRWAAPTGIVMFALLIVQANTGVLSGYRRDATVRSVGVGWRELAGEIEAVRARVGATCVLAPDYGTTGWLAFYLPKGTCVAQQTPAHPLGQHARARSGAACGQAAVCRRGAAGDQPYLKDTFARVERVAELHAQARAAGDRNLRARSARGRQGRRARPLAAAGTAVGASQADLIRRVSMHVASFGTGSVLACARTRR